MSCLYWCNSTSSECPTSPSPYLQQQCEYSCQAMGSSQVVLVMPGVHEEGRQARLSPSFTGIQQEGGHLGREWGTSLGKHTMISY